MPVRKRWGLTKWIQAGAEKRNRVRNVRAALKKKLAAEKKLRKQLKEDGEKF